MAAPPQVQRKRKRTDDEEAEELRAKRSAADAADAVAAAPVAEKRLATAVSDNSDRLPSSLVPETEQAKSIRQLLSESNKSRPRRTKNNTSQPNREEDEPRVRTPPPPARTVIADPPLTTTSYAPQFIMVDGKLQVRSDSVVVERGDDPGFDEALTHVEETAHTRRITSHSFSKRSSNLPWTSDEIDEFYRALRKCGTDFNMIATLLPGRDRNQIRRRFKKEEKDHPERIDFALTHSLPMSAEDTDHLKAAVSVAHTGPKTEDPHVPTTVE